MNQNLMGKLLLSLVAVFTSVSPYLADWNETHIYNPLWTPHAKFHNAQTMLFGAVLGVLALAFLWRPKTQRIHLQVGAIFAALYWVTQMPAILFPGTAFKDPEPQGLNMPIILGHQTTQLDLSVVLLSLVVVGYWLAVRRLPTESRLGSGG